MLPKKPTSGTNTLTTTLNIATEFWGGFLLFCPLHNLDILCSYLTQVDLSLITSAQ